MERGYELLLSIAGCATCAIAATIIRRTQPSPVNDKHR
jgi:hypothetical protein